MKIRKQLAALASVGLALTLAACGGSRDGGGDMTSAPSGGGTSPAETSGGEATSEGGAANAGDMTVAVSMPTQTSERWIADGNAVQAGFEAEGFQVNLQFANDDIPTQQQQIDQMITQGADLLIIGAIDGTALAGQLDAAAAAGIPVVSYDRLIRDTENIDYYVTFDNYQVGVQQATSLLVGLGILNQDGSEAGAAGPFNIELFAGSLDDNNAHFFWQGAIDTLQPYIDNGTLVVKSGQTTIEQAATLRWQQSTAQERMDNLLTASYSDGSKIDGVLSPYDGISRGIVTSLQNAGYTAPGFPVVTGQDAEIASIKLINDGLQFSTIFKDTRKLADEAVNVGIALLNGEEPQTTDNSVLDTETYENGVFVVPSFLLKSDIVYQDNITELLVDSGYWTQEQVDSGVA